mgnify:CR=1 FL=1
MVNDWRGRHLQAPRGHHDRRLAGRWLDASGGPACANACLGEAARPVRRPGDKVGHAGGVEQGQDDVVRAAVRHELRERFPTAAVPWLAYPYGLGSREVEEAAGRASVEPGLFYRFRVSSDIEFVCVDTSKEHFFRRGRLYEFPKHREFLERAFPAIGEDPVRWRIPFGHHPPYSAGPLHHNTDGMEPLIDLFHRSGVRAHFSGHEHNFQHSHVDGIDYFVSGAGAKIRRVRPTSFDSARTLSWSGECHFLVVTIDGDRTRIDQRTLVGLLAILGRGLAAVADGGADDAGGEIDRAHATAEAVGAAMTLANASG